jgi:hypothetical protein
MMRLRLTRGCLVLAALQLFAATSAVSELQVKAAFCYHFAQFTAWPPVSAAGRKSFVACTSGHAAATAFQLAFEGKTLAGRAASVRELVSDRDASDCDLVFLPQSEQKRSLGVQEAISSKSVLIIGDWPGFAAGGGMINFYTEEDKLRFEVNVAASRKAGLMINSQVLRLARIVGPKI